MENYFDMLDLTPTATLAEVKAQYELLLRVYHPGRFVHEADKSYAAHKCAELTRAYRTLIGVEDELIYAQRPKVALPRVEPTLIDWGFVNQGDRLAAQVYVYAQNQSQRVAFTTNDTSAWLSVGRRELVQLAGQTVWACPLLVTTEGLEIGKRYIGQIKVEIDDLATYVFLLMQIEPPYLDGDQAALLPRAVHPCRWHNSSGLPIPAAQLHCG